MYPTEPSIVPILVRILIALVVAAPLLIPFFLRARTMRALAARWDLKYFGKQLPGKFPFDRRGLPVPINNIRRTFHVISGTCNGRDVLILDVVAGPGRGIYSTILAVRTDANPFGSDLKPWKLVESNGWYALCSTRFWQIGYSMSISQIESFLRRL